MSPLAERLARLLDPDRWREWAIEYSILSYSKYLHHAEANVSIGVGTLLLYAVLVNGIRATDGLSLWERWTLGRKASRLARTLERQCSIERARDALAALASDEERAIEQLLGGE